jgi:hypothetical protein
LQLSLQIHPRTLQEDRLNSVPCAYFRVSLRDCALHSSRWVDFAGFLLLGLRFFCWNAKMTRAFVSETIALLRCFRMFVKLSSVTYAARCCLPRMAIMRIMKEDSRIFFAQTLSHLLVEDVHFYSIVPPG